MAVREDTARDVRHEPERHGRHGRPRPFGGRFRLPTLRFSGAAMAMSTVVGISIATTLLLNEQQGVGRRAGVARIGTTPPATPTADEQTEAAAGQTPSADHASGRPSHQHDRGPRRGNDGTTAAGRQGPQVPSPSVPAHGGETTDHDASPSAASAASGPSGTPSAPASGTAGAAGTTDTPSAGPSPHITGPRPISPHLPVPGPAPEPAPAPVPPPGGDGDGDGDVTAAKASPQSPQSPQPPQTPEASGDDAAETPLLVGSAQRTPLGPDGLRHRLDLTVIEPVTALQVEFRLAPGTSAPGTDSAWTDLPGAEVTVLQERGTLVYRFTTPPGTDVRPGRYGFGVSGARPVGVTPAESWSAAAFGIDHPHAVATLGAFPAPPPAPSPTPSSTPSPAPPPVLRPAPKAPAATTTTTTATTPTLPKAPTTTP
ncbi:hypothetical protein ACIBCA_34185 [Kitasatospora sp. NPDC051170]|uniref:hypothetical protein n=1 Tax=Kitasatospora sp. NPDC051170 TaxID=3364056 RepID=UPI003799EA34